MRPLSSCQTTSRVNMVLWRLHYGSASRLPNARLRNKACVRVAEVAVMGWSSVSSVVAQFAFVVSDGRARPELSCRTIFLWWVRFPVAVLNWVPSWASREVAEAFYESFAAEVPSSLADV